MDQEDSLTTEWVSKELPNQSLFDRVNYFIHLAREKVARGDYDEWSAEAQNIAREVIEEVACGYDRMEILEEEEEEFSDENEILKIETSPSEPQISSS